MSEGSLIGIVCGTLPWQTNGNVSDCDMSYRASALVLMPRVVCIWNPCKSQGYSVAETDFELSRTAFLQQLLLGVEYGSAADAPW